LEEAQTGKLDLVCRNLRLRPGEAFLDIGCGWGALIRHAAKNYAVKAVGETLSREQAKFGAEEIQRPGRTLQGRGSEFFEVDGLGAFETSPASARSSMSNRSTAILITFTAYSRQAAGSAITVSPPRRPSRSVKAIRF
jgi:hypothetical protein